MTETIQRMVIIIVGIFLLAKLLREGLGPRADEEPEGIAGWLRKRRLKREGRIK